MLVQYFVYCVPRELISKRKMSQVVHIIIVYVDQLCALLPVRLNTKTSSSNINSKLYFAAISVYFIHNIGFGQFG